MPPRSLSHVAAVVLTVAAVLVLPGFAGGTSQTLKVTSTLDGRRVLPSRIHWTARPAIASSKVEEVDFLIDGRLAWIEHTAPYAYGNDGNWLVTSFLKPGMHTFTVKAVTLTTRKVAADVVKARVVAAAAPPTEIAGAWTRVVTADDVTKCTSDQCAPAGTWGLTISSRGWAVHDPEGGGGLFDVAYLAGGELQMRPTIEYPTYPNANNGGWCADTDPLWVWTGVPSGDGKTLRLDPAGIDPCGDRASVLEGTWMRSG